MKLNREQRELLAHIKNIWEGNPNLRFLQLIGNSFSNPVSLQDIYYITDDKLITGLTVTYR